MKQITEKALLQALQKARTPREGGRGIRVEEIRKLTGENPEAIRRCLREFAEQGHLGVSDRTFVRFDGKRATVRAYYWKGK